jgi:hypothetical protein
MNTLRKKLTAIGLAGTVGLGTLAISPVQVLAAPIAPSQNTVKQSAPSQNEQVRHRGRWIAPAIALGIIGAAAAHQYHRNYYYGPGPYYYGPRYRAYYGPAYYYGPGPYYYYGW